MTANALTVIHKYIRRELFDVSQHISCAGPGQVETVKTAIAAATELLHAHAAHEEAGFEPRLRELNADYAQRMMDDHQRLHAELDAINQAAEKLNAAQADVCVESLLQLHLDWNRFVGGYLLHLDDEERTLFTVGGDLIPPVGSIAAAAASQGAEEGKAFLQKLFAVIAPVERESIENARAGMSLEQ